MSHYNILKKDKILKMEYIRTPKEIWNELIKEFKFTVDACASDKNHLVDKYWTKENSALDKNWDNEIVYCHPMYDTKIPKFVEKAFKHKCLTVFLLPASTNSQYFHKFFWDNKRCKSRSNVQIKFLPVVNRQLGYKMATDDGELPERGYLRPLMVIKVDNR
jgi:hypothetical protein|tara:strand:- start:343 stop:825 length:483 start_codon:yes stop_codon:yes gene_type:complete